MNGMELIASASASGCVFCRIVAGEAPAAVVRRWRAPRGSLRRWLALLRGTRRWGEVIAIRPRRGGCTAGHLLVIPRQHVADVGIDRHISARTMACAAEFAGELEACNIIASRGSAATQTMFHLHIHVVPRAAGDELPLPWAPQQAVQRAGAQAGPDARGGRD